VRTASQPQLGATHRVCLDDVGLVHDNHRRAIAQHLCQAGPFRLLALLALLRLLRCCRIPLGQLRAAGAQAALGLASRPALGVGDCRMHKRRGTNLLVIKIHCRLQCREACTRQPHPSFRSPQPAYRHHHSAPSMENMSCVMISTALGVRCHLGTTAGASLLSASTIT